MSKYRFSIDDRGPARYFHGRQDILKTFSDRLQFAVNKDYRENGTIFLIQGSPGAGKTALLYKCSDLAEAGGAEVGGKKWRVVNLKNYSPLYNPAALMNRAGKTYTYGKTTEMSGHAGLSVPGFGGGGSELKRTHQSADEDIIEILNKLARKEPLLLVLDEVQEIGNLSTEKQEILKETLGPIHNGTLEHPVVLLCGGLGTSSTAFGHLGISRFRRNCVVHLGRLSAVNEKAVIRDWLVKHGGAREEDITPWIQAIARETHGWPQHIVIYAEPAATLLEAQNGNVTQESLHIVLQEGRAGKQEYYHGRSETLSDLEVDALAAVLYNAPASGGLKQSVLLQGLMNMGNITKEKAEKIFQKALHKGVLSNAGTGSPRRYDVPIPSMKSYLFEEAGIMVPSRKGDKENGAMSRK